MKKKIGILLVLAFGIGFLLPIPSKGFYYVQALCYSAQTAGGPGDGYYRCSPIGATCTWIDEAKKDGPSSYCSGVQE